jgi:hypothetical protein
LRAFGEEISYFSILKNDRFLHLLYCTDARSGRFLFFSLNFLLQGKKNGRAEEINNRDLKSVADLFQRGNRKTMVSSARNIVERGLRDPREDRKLIECDFSFGAKLTNSVFAGFSHRHNKHLFLLYPNSFELKRLTQKS